MFNQSGFIRVLVVGIVIIILGIVYSFILHPVMVGTDKMEPLIKRNGVAIVDKFFYKFFPIQRREVVLYKNDIEQQFIARVVGLPNEKFKIAGGKVFINGNLLEEPYVTGETYYDAGSIKEDFEVTIPEENYIILVDKRFSSVDSRTLQSIPRFSIKGKYLFSF